MSRTLIYAGKIPPSRYNLLCPKCGGWGSALGVTCRVCGGSGRNISADRDTTGGDGPMRNTCVVEAK